MKLENMSREEIVKWVDENVLSAAEAREITNQSQDAFTQSVTSGHMPILKSFSRIHKVYLKSDAEEYARTKRKK